MFTEVYRSKVEKKGRQDDFVALDRHRSRLVAGEINKDKRQDLFSDTPPLETSKLLLAECAKRVRGKPRV